VDIEPELSGKISTTARLTKEQVSMINTAVKLGYFQSKPRFVLDAMRDLDVRMTKDLLNLIPEILSRYVHPLDRYDALKSAMMKIYLDNSGYKENRTGKPTELINLVFPKSFYAIGAANAKLYLDIDNLQDWVDVAIYFKLREFAQYILDSQKVTKIMKDELGKSTEKVSEDDVQDILKKTGYLK
jgi:Arc/MetJ-type ribon-helix-helix transcriptional regulator